ERKKTQRNTDRNPEKGLASAPLLHPSSFGLHPFAWWQPFVIIGAGALVYANSLYGAFVFDDVRAITNKRYIIDPLPAWKQVFGMPRPLVIWSLAANYAISGRDPWSYHVFNILVHIAASLTLYGLVRRTVNLCIAESRVGWQDLLALAIAVLFVVHPL